MPLGWGSPGVLGPIIAGLILLAAFLVVEARVAQAPLVPLSIFRIGQLRAANLVVVLLYSAFFPVWFFLTLYLQQVLHYSALKAGLSYLPLALTIIISAGLASQAVTRLGHSRG